MMSVDPPAGPTPSVLSLVEDLRAALACDPELLFMVASSFVLEARQGDLRVAGGWQTRGSPPTCMRPNVLGEVVGQVLLSGKGMHAIVSPAPGLPHRTVATREWSQWDTELGKGWVDGVLLDLGWELL